MRFTLGFAENINLKLTRSMMDILPLILFLYNLRVIPHFSKNPIRYLDSSNFLPCIQQQYRKERDDSYPIMLLFNFLFKPELFPHLFSHTKPKILNRRMHKWKIVSAAGKFALSPIYKATSKRNLCVHALYK